MPAARPWPIYLAAAVTFAGLQARTLLVPLRVLELGGSRLEVGLLYTVFTVAAAGLALPAGALADRLGRRSLIVGATILGGVSQLGLGLSGAVAPMFLWQVLAGLASGGSQSAMYAAVGDAVPAARLGRAIGWLTLSFQFGFLAGPALAGISLNFLSLQQALLASAAPFALAAILAVVGVPGRQRAAGTWKVGGPLRDILRQPGFAGTALALFGATLVWGTQQAYLPALGTEQLRIPAASIGYMIAVQAVVNGLSRLPAGRLVDRARSRWTIVVGGLASYSAAIAVLPHTSGFWEPTILLALAVPPVAAAFIALGVAFSGFAQAGARGLAMGVYSTVLFLGLGGGPAAFGPLMQGAGYTWGFTVCGLTGLAFALLVTLVIGLPGVVVRHRLEPPDPLLEGRVGGEQPSQRLPGERVDDVEVRECRLGDR
jgi:MFS family permease